MIRVMTYNILDGGVGREADVQAVIGAIQPDILVLQEVYDAAFAQRVADSLAMTSLFPPGNQRRRVALLSRLPIHTHANDQTFPPIWRNMLQATIQCPSGQLLHLCGVHLLANLTMPYEAWRWWELRYLVRRLAPPPTALGLIAGDLNTLAPGDPVDVAGMPPWLQRRIWLQGQRVYRLAIPVLLRQQWRDCFRTLHPTETGWTLPTPTPNTRLDYVFATPTLRPHLHACWVVRTPAAVDRASDHYPVVAEFDL